MRPAPELPPELLENARILPNRKHILRHIPEGLVWAEVGVALGGFSREILKTCKPSRFLAIDIYNLHTLDRLWDKPTAELFEGQTHRAFFEKTFTNEVEAGVMEVYEGDSAQVLAALPDASIDALYLDADHTYEGVQRDLEALRTKIKPDGYLILNDYTFLENVGSKDEYGVIQAGHEFMIEHGWEMTFLALERFMFCDVCLRKRT